MRDELRAGVCQGLVIGAAALAFVLPLRSWMQRDAGTPSASPAVVTEPAAPPRGSDTARTAAPSSPAPRMLDLAGMRVPAPVQRVARWAVESADHVGHAFAVIDKPRAHVHVFNGHGRLLGASPVLLGYAAGDGSAAGIGQRPVDQVKPHERTTPAGRFVAEPGRNALGEQVVWVDYDNAVSMHRVRATNPSERRLQRLSSPTAADNRISYGCINVPAEFFDRVVWPTLGTGRSVIYVLPERLPLLTVFPGAIPGGATGGLPLT